MSSQAVRDRLADTQVTDDLAEAIWRRVIRVMNNPDAATGHERRIATRFSDQKKKFETMKLHRLRALEELEGLSESQRRAKLLATSPALDADPEK